MQTSAAKNLRIIVITQGISRILEPVATSGHNLVGIIESAPRNHKQGSRLRQLRRVVAKLSAGFGGSPTSLESYAKNKNIPYRFMTSSDDPGLEDWVRSLAPDLIVVFSMSQLLKEKIFSIPTYGSINLHTAFLPEYRGPNPDFWHYYDMQMEPGATVHYIAKGEDTGDIIYQERISIALGTKSPARLDKLIGEVGVSLVLKAMHAIRDGNAPRIAQAEISPTRRARNVLPHEHQELIDWGAWPVERIWHVLRGTELWLNALAQPGGVYSGQRWTIEGYDHDSKDVFRAGQVYNEAGKYFVACSGGKIYLSRRFRIRNLLIRLLRG